MISAKLKDLQIWNPAKRQMENKYPVGTFEFDLVDTIIACFEEAEEEGVEPEVLIGKSRKQPQTIYRGFMINAFFEKFVELGCMRADAARISTKIFNRDRTAACFYSAKHRNGNDVMYEAIRESPFAQRIITHLSFLKLDVNRKLRLSVRSVSISSIINLSKDCCPECREKINNFIDNS